MFTMAVLENVDRISFVVDVLMVRNGRTINTLRPDDDGYYTVPLAVLGTPTDNLTYYDVEDFVAQLTSKDSFVYRCLTDGKLYGEYGHPMISMLPDDKQIPRLMQIDEKQVSHHIKRIYTGEKLETGGRIIYGLLKPTGPYSKPLRESLDDACMNTAFSLRSIAQSRNVGGLTRRKIKHLVTFDFVNAGGYAEASKRYAPSVESLIDRPINAAMLQQTSFAMEHFTNSELNEIFGAKLVTIGTQSTTFIPKHNALQGADGKLQSVYTRLMGDLSHMPKDAK